MLSEGKHLQLSLSHLGRRACHVITRLAYVGRARQSRGYIITTLLKYTQQHEAKLLSFGQYI